MARKKKEPDQIDKIIQELTRNATAAELVNDPTMLRDLKKRLVESALEAEMTDHLGYEKHAPDGNNTGNSRNGKSSKRILDAAGDFQIEVPRDRNGDFEPQIVRKRQVRLAGFDQKVLSLYARGMTTREIQDHLQELYEAEVSPALISKVTDAVLDEVKAWQGRPLDAVYPIVYLDAVHLKIRTDGRVQNRAVYVALGVDLTGSKQLLGLWIGEVEGAKFWLNVLTELSNRGVRDILIASVDGLTGFPEAIASVFPKTEVQLCVVHLVRNSLRYVPWKHRKAVARDLRRIYTAATVEAATQALEAFEQDWGEQYPMAVKTWRTRWDNITPFFGYPEPIRKVIYTTNAVESLNAQLRQVTKKRGSFPTDDSVRKVLYLAMARASKRWTMPIQDWPAAMNFFSIVFGERVPV
ncbi:MAG: IS256 family transposase [bacterium]|nr:IS256 family transposase [bacterium]